MLCPKCQNLMHSYERNGVLVDQCTECRGLFLDRGELERLVTAEGSWQAQGSPAGHPVRAGGGRRHDGDGYPERYADRERHDEERSRYEQHWPRKKRARSFLEELFDD